MIKRHTFIIIVMLLPLQLFRLNFVAAALHIERINPYKEVLLTRLKEPPVGGTGNNSNSNLRDHVAEKWLEQKLDHFAGGANNETWLMRYYVNSDFYQPDGPIFIVVGGEWEISSHLLRTGHFYDMAHQHGAIMYYTEHRYYGQSWPKGDASVESLKYLNVQQSLADLKHFIEIQKSTMKSLSEAKVILAGGSYSGSMVTWFMKVYPEMAVAAWASSAPLEAKMDFYDYMKFAMASIKEKGGIKCARNLEKAFQGLHKLLHSSKADELLERLQVCSHFDVSNPMDQTAFFNSLGNYFATVVQSQGGSINQFCWSFLSMNSNPTEALIDYIRQLFLPPAETEEQGETGNDDYYCLDLSYEGIKSIFSANGDIYTGTRCWFYQTCHEFGWFATTTTTTLSQNFSSWQFDAATPFAGQVSLEFFQHLCHDVFATANATSSGSDVDDNPFTLTKLHSSAERTNHIFGGLTNISQRVIFTHGLLDPWRAVGLQSGQNVLLLPDYSHVEDLGSINLRDTVEMNVAKLKVAAFINKALRVSK